MTQVPGTSWPERFEAAQDLLDGPGVVYFPPGRYALDGPLRLRDGIVLRGAPPTEAQTTLGRLALPTVLACAPPSIAEAEAGVVLRDPATASRCGVVDVEIENGRVDLGGGTWKRTGSRRLVIGCRLLACARLVSVDEDSVWVDRRTAAITVDVDRDALVQGNVLSRSPVPSLGIDLDNRPGIAVNRHSIGGSADSEFDGFPLVQPFAFRRGLVIEGNYVESTGRAAITFTGDGTVCRANTVRFEPEVRRDTVDGLKASSGSQSNDIRGVNAGGWNWKVEDNDFRIFSNQTLDESVTNDGQALLHTDHANSEVKGAVIRGNVSNAPFDLLHTGGILGCQVLDNEIRVVRRAKKRATWAIRIIADRQQSRHRCQEVSIEDNVVDAGIWIAGKPARENRIARNRSVNGIQPILNEADAEVLDNEAMKVGQRHELGMS